MRKAVPDEGIQIPSALFLDGVAGEEAAVGGRIVAVVVVDQIQFRVVERLFF